MCQRSPRFCVTAFAIMLASINYVFASELSLKLTYQLETSLGADQFHRLSRSEQWDSAKTAIIVCDMWDSHHCLNAVRRVNQIAPRLNLVLEHARAAGVTIIHSPSDCMEAYRDHPARQRAVQTPVAKDQPFRIADWCSAVPAEERAAYPIDQTDGGEDDDPLEHAQWVAQLKQAGRNPGMPWKTQHPELSIDEQRDYISDRGDEVWNILEARQITNVILTGVHTNMCVVGRPFGLRQMARAGKHVVLMRDMTDTMYNPERWPYVSHFTGTDRVIDHIERYICPTITSDQLIGGQPLRFRGDNRPHVVIVMAESLYDTAESLTRYANDYLGQEFRVSLVYSDKTDPNHLPGIDVIDDADLLIVSVRRRALPKRQLARVRAHVAAGKPVLGLRTASHAFSVRSSLDANLNADQWPTFDRDVLGGNYQGHHANDLRSTVSVATKSEITQGVEPVFPQGGSLYRNAPLPPGTTTILNGDAEGVTTEPVAWTFTRAGGGRSFYTSLGHPDDFLNNNFTQLLYNAIHWCVGRPVQALPTRRSAQWKTANLPATGDDQRSWLWYRAVVHLPAEWNRELQLRLPVDVPVQAWLNGKRLQPGDVTDKHQQLAVAPDSVYENDANLLVLRIEQAEPLAHVPTLVTKTGEQLRLAGRWQVSKHDVASFSDLPLPAKFAAASNIVFTPPRPIGSPQPLTPTGLFTAGIEGPACDADGNIYAVNFQRQGTIGRIRPDGRGEVFVELPEGSVGNGIRFDQQGNFFVADYTGHNILHVDVRSKKITTFAHNDQMNQPNDLAITADGTLYASDPNWKDGTGQVWRIDRDGSTHLVAKEMGTTNGIEVSPDGTTLYVNESVQRNVWRFTIEADGTLSNQQRLKQFEDEGLDGMRCDADGNLFVTRYGKGTVVKLSPNGDTLAEYPVLGARPSNLCFGGRDGKTLYVTEVESTRLVKLRIAEE